MKRFLRPFVLMTYAVVLIAGGHAADAQQRFDQSIGVSGGMYAASGFGTNFYYCGRYTYYVLGGRYSLEAALGVGSLQSKVLDAVTKAQLFKTDRLLIYEFGFAYDANPAGNIPYFMLGVAGVNQGGETSFAGVVGVGKRVPIVGLFGVNAFGFRYDVRDQIFSQRLNNGDPFVVHNIYVTLGMQVYF